MGERRQGIGRMALGSQAAVRIALTPRKAGQPPGRYFRTWTASGDRLASCADSLSLRRLGASEAVPDRSTLSRTRAHGWDSSAGPRAHDAACQALSF